MSIMTPISLSVSTPHSSWPRLFPSSSSSWTSSLAYPTIKCAPTRSFNDRTTQTRLTPPLQAALVRVPALEGGEAAGGGDVEAKVRATGRVANASVYSPQFLAAKYGSKPVKVARRALQILISLGWFAFKQLLDHRNGVVDQNKRRRAAELKDLFTRLGPTFVKLGQGLSIRPDICPPEYLEELSELQDNLPMFPNDEAFSCIERELGASLDSIFSYISPSPIAAASLGQVYKARLKCSGKLVAVKVQRPGVEEVIGLDFYLLRALAFLINEYVDVITSDVVALIDEFGSKIFQELNYVQEGQNANRFKKLYADKEDIFVPDVFWDHTSGKVLTMEWVHGVKLNEKEAIERQGLKLLDLVNTGVQCSLRQLLEYGYFHADLHPGNLLATPEGKLAFIDFGMMSETPEEARLAIIGHIVHLVNRDYEAMAHDYYALNFLSPDVDITPIIPALRDFFDDALSYTVQELNFKTVVDGLGHVMYQYPFNVPGYYALILRSLTVLEDPNPYLRGALIQLLFKDGRFRWNRLESLLIQGRKDRDFSAKEVLQPVLKLLLMPDGEYLRTLVTKETALVSEAFIVSTMSDTYKSIPRFMRSLVFNGSANGPLMISDSELESMIELRDQVLRIWGLLSSNDFDPSFLLPILEVLQQQESRRFAGHVAGGITNRLAARFLQQLLQTQKKSST
ncbi:hypothetical protein K1719_040148 [Acacia pycnantha]|nr:hypothetical protein K1719_040148 [Acacia pycnantha]